VYSGPVQATPGNKKKQSKPTIIRLLSLALNDNLCSFWISKLQSKTMFALRGQELMLTLI
jgi:hypothetical protein